VQRGDGYTADRRATDEARSIPAEMRFPFVAAGIEHGVSLRLTASMPLMSEPLKELGRKPWDGNRDAIR
jgi:hypothetical protein